MPYNDLRKGRFSQIGQAYVVTVVCAGREPIFADFDAARLAIKQMRDLHDSGAVESQAFVVMPDHVHWLFTLMGTHTLSDTVRLFKGRCAVAVNGVRGRTGPLWQRAFYDHALRADEDLREQARYIVANPLRAGLVESIGDYSHWDAVWLEHTLGG